MLKAYMLFIIAGLAEIGGGYLVWLWLRNGKPTWVGVVGGFLLFLYGVVATRQEFLSFGKVYAAYGGVFIVMSVLWGWVVAKDAPNLSEWVGAGICLIGVTVILIGPK
ncbi:YnfA family protein [Alicyclobacillus acidiphilus]|uniref:YnfA family protein n=1 Tax=Alicyclobacillus acidiphilus TaxID=182455 RepID=UPI000832DDC1|nr:YnfA family protein [Alicyclobacillus acidiphilus]